MGVSTDQHNKEGVQDSGSPSNALMGTYYINIVGASPDQHNKDLYIRMCKNFDLDLESWVFVDLEVPGRSASTPSQL